MGSGDGGYDVIVVGCGIAGLSAAVSAQQAGARVALLERAPKEERGGNTRYTESFWRMQSHDEVSEDFVDRFAENAGGHLDPAMIADSVKPYDAWPRLLRGLGFVDPELVTTLADNAGPTLRWLTGFGVEFDFLPNYFLTESTTRMAPAGGGLALVEALAAHAETVPDRIAIHYEATARRLIQGDDGRVSGVEATGASNRTMRLRARSVVLASGGFEGNPEMLSRYLGPQSQFIRPVARGGYYNRGEGTLHNCNLDQRIEARFEVAGGRAMVTGETVLDGVAGQGAPIRLSFLEPGGAVTGRLLPTGHVRDVLDVPGSGPIEATLIDASTALVIVRADALGLTGVELPDAIEADGTLTARLEAIRHTGAVAMGIAPETESVPKVGFVAPPADAATLSGARLSAGSVDLSARVISMGRPHRALPLTAALALAAAARIPGTIAAEATRSDIAGDGLVRLGHPSGVAEVAVDLATPDPPRVTRVTVTRTARRLMEGRVLVPTGRLASALGTA